MSCRDVDLDLDPPGLPVILDRPPGSGKVLVLAPHADDETIGVGGTLILHRQAGDPVDVLFLTRGTAGDAQGRYDPEDYVRIRREEGRAACRLLGVREVFFWDYPDNHVVTENDMAVLVPRLLEILRQGAYDVVYTPHRGEIHTDHHASAVMAIRAAARLERPPRVFGYEIWAPLAADYIVDVSAVFDEKLKVAACYRSQLEIHDVTRLFRCLNGYRAVFLENKAGYGEALAKLGGGA